MATNYAVPLAPSPERAEPTAPVGLTMRQKVSRTEIFFTEQGLRLLMEVAVGGWRPEVLGAAILKLLQDPHIELPDLGEAADPADPDPYGLGSDLQEPAVDLAKRIAGGLYTVLWRVAHLGRQAAALQQRLLTHPQEATTTLRGLSALFRRAENKIYGTKRAPKGAKPKSAKSTT